MNAPCRADKAVLRSRLEIHSSAHQADDNQKHDHLHETSVNLCFITNHYLFNDLMFDIVMIFSFEYFASGAKYFPYFLVVRSQRVYYNSRRLKFGPLLLHDYSISGSQESFDKFVFFDSGKHKISALTSQRSYTDCAAIKRAQIQANQSSI